MQPFENPIFNIVAKKSNFKKNQKLCVARGTSRDDKFFVWSTIPFLENLKTTKTSLSNK